MFVLLALAMCAPQTDKCVKYTDLFMEVLHESIECSEDFARSPKEEEKCEKLYKQLDEYSQLRLIYCYDEWQNYEL